MRAGPEPGWKPAPSWAIQQGLLLEWEAPICASLALGASGIGTQGPHCKFLQSRERCLDQLFFVFLLLPFYQKVEHRRGWN